MTFNTKQYDGRTYYIYKCSRYAVHGKSTCSIHHIPASALEEAVLQNIRFNAQLLSENDEELLEKLIALGNRGQQCEMQEARTKLNEAVKRLEVVEDMAQKLFEERCTGNVPDSVFKKLMQNYDIESVKGSVFYKLGHLPEATEGNIFGKWDPETYEVEDSAFGFITMKNGATIELEASWALNILESREASTTLCGTLAGAEIRSGMSYPKDELIMNRGANGLLLEEHISETAGVAYFEGATEAPGVLEADQWLRAIETDSEPLVKPEEAFRVTKVLEAIYRSAETRQEIRF